MDTLFKEAARWGTYITLPLLIFMVFNAEDVLKILGEDYKEASVIVLMIFFSQFFNTFVGPNGTLLNMSGNQKYELLNGVVFSTVSITLSLMLARVSSWGIAAAYSLGILMVNLVKTLEVGFMLGIWPYTRKDMYFIAFLLAFEMAVFRVAKNIRAGNVAEWILLNILIVISLMIFSFIISPHEGDRRVLRRIFSKLTRSE